MNKLFYIFSFLLISSALFPQKQYKKNVKPTKNVIVMIPDGTSIGVVSAARWYQTFNNPDKKHLAIDPYMCGTVQTYCSDAPIGDSAPTTSCYMTGIPQQAGNVSIYPMVNPLVDLVKLDSTLTYQPLMTVLEGAKYLKNKATGLVVTCEFPHATPADCASHYYARGKYEYIAPQMAYNNLDVMFGGGNSILTNDIKKYFNENGTILIQDDIKAFREFNGTNKVWALFGERELPYDLDRDDNKVPSLAEMTAKAIDRLSKNENGFFLMVEGSKIDWTAHANDAVGCITEYLAFDKAVHVALEFAKKNGETTVIVLPDHGNSGFSIGRRDLKNYSKASLAELFENVSKYKKTAEGLEKILLKAEPSQFRALFKEYTDIDLTDEELQLLINSKNYKEKDYTKVNNNVNMSSSIVQIMNSYTYFGFTTGGHTGEEVFLAAYHPDGDIPIGMNTNIEINQYLCDVTGLDSNLADVSKKVFAKHYDVFKNLKYSIEVDKMTDMPQLNVTKGKKKLIIPAFKSVVYLDGKPININTVTVYIDKNNIFYIPESLGDLLR